jgi:hypothetical protein
MCLGFNRRSEAKFQVASSWVVVIKVLRQHVPISGAESGVSGRKWLLGALGRALGVIHYAHWS